MWVNMDIMVYCTSYGSVVSFALNLPHVLFVFEYFSKLGSICYFTSAYVATVTSVVETCLLHVRK
jgi:hypothetical protein